MLVMSSRYYTKFFSLIIVIVLICCWTDIVLANRTLRCSGRLVSIGDTRSEVLDKCDEPDRIERWEVDRDTWISRYFNYETERYEAPRLTKGPIQMERWTYDFGPTRLTHYLLFENNQLIGIETGDKASDSSIDPN